MFLAPLDRSGLREAMVRPLAMVGHRFESEQMVEMILDEIENTVGALPLLQFAATQLWDSRDRDKRVLTETAYHAMDGVTGALIAHADRVMNDLGPAARPRVRTLFQRLVTTDKTRDIVDMRELIEMGSDRGETERLIERLVRARLLVVNTDTEEPTVELVHESLITNWPLLAQWIDEEKESHVFLTQLRSSAKLWDSRGRPKGLLWLGDSLLDARRWKSRYSEAELMPRERDYLMQSFAQDDRSRRRRRALLVSAMTFLSLVAVGASVAVYFISKKTREVEISRISEAGQRARAEDLNREVQLQTKALTDKLAEAEAQREKMRLLLLEAETARAAAEDATRKAEEATLQKEKTLQFALEQKRLADKRYQLLEERAKKERTRKRRGGLSEDL
jgi:hypothetical protein